MSSGALQILPDASVLFSRTLRDWILMIHLQSVQPLYYVYSTEDILAEVVANLRARRPMAAEGQIGGVRRRILESCGAERVIVDYQIDGDRDYRDPKDAHPHAAARAGGVDIIVTDNSKDVVAIDDDPYEVMTADEFLLLVDDSSPETVRAVTIEQYRYWVGRGGGRPLPEQLRACSVPGFADRIARHLRAIGVPHDVI